MNTETYLIVILALAIPIAIFGTRILVTRRLDKQISDYASLKEAHSNKKNELETVNKLIEEAGQKFMILARDTADLKKLKEREDTIEAEITAKESNLDQLQSQIASNKIKLDAIEAELHELQSKLDLYSRIDEFTEFGHFELPKYLYETSKRFAEEIKVIRNQQRDLISGKKAIEFPPETEISDNKSQNTRILNGQVKLMLSAFNVECDFLIGKVSPSNYSRTLERIEKAANSLEKSAASLHCGFNIDYIDLKFQECTLQYQFKLRKQEEQEEQRRIREQMREEEKVRREYEAAVRKAEEEERLYRDLLEKARVELDYTTASERASAEKKIKELEAKLAEAEAKEERAKSMAELTRRGHVYIISNVGSFGDGIFKIGLTRRLDPMERVKELGDASVPFPFDVHAFVLVEDAPALEKALHLKFTNRRVNAVNLRKEFFKVELEDIKEAVEELAGSDVDFTLTIAAEEYYESKRLIDRTHT